MKTCTKCSEIKPLEDFGRYVRAKDGLRPACKACHAKANAQWRRANPERQVAYVKKWRQAHPEYIRKRNKETDREWYRNNRVHILHRTRAAHLKRSYGLTLDDYNELVAIQGGACAACDKVPGQTLRVDHCHTTGDVRGLLCHNCNVALGLLKDDPDRIMALAAYVGCTVC